MSQQPINPDRWENKPITDRDPTSSEKIFVSNDTVTLNQSLLTIDSIEIPPAESLRFGASYFWNLFPWHFHGNFPRGIGGSR